VPFQKFGRYEIERELGRGGMAVVYLARDPYMKRQVAVKVLPHQFTSDPQFRARFQREAEIIAALEHPHIVPIYDYGEQDEQLFLVMRYMTGGSLADRVRRGPLSTADIARIVTPLAAALDKAHTRGIIHRDLKPGNILFDADGEPYISDFGIAKLTQASTLLSGSALVGTPVYMSPEQWRGEAVDGRSDIYALGGMLYEMISGRVPYEASTPAEVMFKCLMEPPPRLLDTISDISPMLETVVARAMAKVREERFSTAGEMARALETAIRGAPYGVSGPIVGPAAVTPAPAPPLPAEIAPEAVEVEAVAAPEAPPPAPITVEETPAAETPGAPPAPTIPVPVAAAPEAIEAVAELIPEAPPTIAARPPAEITPEAVEAEAVAAPELPPPAPITVEETPAAETPSAPPAPTIPVPIAAAPESVEAVVQPIPELPPTVAAPLEAPAAEAESLPMEATENLSGLRDLTGLGPAAGPELTAEIEPLTRTPTVITPPAQPALRRAPRPLARLALPAVGVVVIALLIVGGAIFGPRIFSSTTAVGTPTEMSVAIVESSPSPTRTVSPTPTLTSTPAITPTRTPLPTATSISEDDAGWVEPIVAFSQPILAAIANRTPDFQDDFSTQAFWRWSGVDASCAAWRLKYSDGALVVTGCHRVMLLGETYEDFVVEVEGQFLAGTSGSWWDLYFRSASNDPNSWRNQEIVRINIDGNLVGAWDWKTGWPGAVSGNLNHLMVIARGRRVAVYVNRQPIILWEAATPKRGYFALGAGGTVSFDNFKVWDISDLPLAATPTPGPIVTSTSAATGAVKGRILWGDEPFAGVTAKVCTQWLSRCETAEYSAVSDARGNYTISGIPPGDYYFITKTPDEEGETRWQDYAPDKPWVIKVVAGQTVTVDDVHAWKHDLQLISPAHGATVSSKTPTLSWKAYPGAAEYVVVVECPAGGGGAKKYETTTTQWTVDFTLSSGESCDWQVAAKNGPLLAISPGYRRFIVP
jgi:serine/threonine-protein kinase